MRYILLVCLATSYLQVFSQELTFKKRVIEDWSEVDISQYPDHKKELIEILRKKTNKLTTHDKTKIALSDLETLIHCDENFTYKVTHENTEGRRLVKLDKSMNEIASQEFSIEGALDVLDDGYLLTNDFAHGDVSTYTFYSPDLKPIGYYHPYESGAINTNSDGSGRYVCVFSQQQMNSQKFKIAVLERFGTLLNEKEFDIVNFLPVEIKIYNNKIFLHLVSIIDARSKILSLDLNLNLNYEKDFSLRVIGYKLKFDPKSNFLLLGTSNSLQCFSDTGKEVWKANIALEASIKILASEFVSNNQHIAVLTGTYVGNGRSKISKYENCALTIINAKTGGVISKENIGDLVNSRIIGGNKGFLFLNNNQFFQYEN